MVRRHNLRSFLDELLHVVLAEASVAGIVHLANERDRLGLADGDDSDRLRRAASAIGCQLDAVEHRSERGGCHAVHCGGGGHAGVGLVLPAFAFFVLRLSLLKIVPLQRRRHPALFVTERVPSVDSTGSNKREEPTSSML